MFFIRINKVFDYIKSDCEFLGKGDAFLSLVVRGKNQRLIELFIEFFDEMRNPNM